MTAKNVEDFFKRFWTLVFLPLRTVCSALLMSSSVYYMVQTIENASFYIFLKEKKVFPLEMVPLSSQRLVVTSRRAQGLQLFSVARVSIVDLGQCRQSPSTNE